jgi:hypothetical protein
MFVLSYEFSGTTLNHPLQRPTVKELLKHKFIRLAKNTSHLAELMERHQRWKMQGALKEEQDATHRENNL